MFFKTKQKQEIENIDDVKEIIKNLEKRVSFLEGELEKEKEKSLKYFSKVEVKRFNPFKEMGGDQSFTLGILNKENDGFLITSFYAKEDSRIFTKPINNGICEYQLLEEEREILKKMTND